MIDFYGNHLNIRPGHKLALSRTEDWARFLDRNIRDPGYREHTNETIDQCIELIRKGLGQKEIQKEMELGKKEASIIFEVGHARINISGKFQKWNRLWMDQYLSRYSTPEAVCRYRSSRITGYDVIEAGSGAGMQSIFLSQSNESVTSFEIQPERTRMAKLNAEEYRTGKLKFLQGDIYAISPSVEIDDGTLIFSDPARPPMEGERTMQSLIPSPENLVRIFGNRTGNFAFDLPPQMSWEKMSIEGEKEYLSIDGALNRLTLYLGDLHRDESSAVILPQGYRISGVPRHEVFPDSHDTGNFLALPDPSVVYAGLAWKVREEFGLVPLWKDNRRLVYTSEKEFTNFPGELFRVLGRASGPEVGSMLKLSGAGRAYPRFSLGDSEFYELKKRWEDGLTGEMDVYIFRHDDQYILSEKVK